MDLVVHAARWLRELLLAQPWPQGWLSAIAQTPDWALVAAGPGIVLLALTLFALTPRGKSRRKRSAPLQKKSAPQTATGNETLVATATPGSKPTTMPACRATGVPNENDQERKARVFLSSTFRDMRTEREVLATDTFPALKRKFRARGVEIQEVDLRWGVNEGDAPLDVCLAAVRRCNWFVGLVGQRYGTILEDAATVEQLGEDYPVVCKGMGRSLTEIEILEGVLNGKCDKQVLFFEREEKWLDTLSASERPEYEEKNPDAQAKLGDLKARIREHVGAMHVYPSPIEIGTVFKQRVTEALERAFPPVEDADDPGAQEHRLHAAYARERLGLFVGGDHNIDTLNEWMDEDGAEPKLIVGASGSGKSALVSNWVQGRRASHPNDIIFAHYLGASTDSADPRALVRRLWAHLDAATGEKIPPPNIDAKPDEMRDALSHRLGRASAVAARDNSRILIALDGLDKLAEEDRDMRWWPRALNPQVKLVASSLDGKAREAGVERRWSELAVKPFDAAQQSQFITDTLKIWNKSDFPEARKRLVLGHVLASLPLFLKTILDELRISAAHEVLDARLADYLKAPDMPDLFIRILTEIESECGKELVAQALSIIWASRAGIEEDEIVAILTQVRRQGAGSTGLDWERLRNRLADNLRDQHGRITFNHDYLREAVENVYVKRGEAKAAVHLLLAEHFSQHFDVRRRAEEWPWQLKQSGQIKDFEDAIFDIDNVAMFMEYGLKDRLYEYWLDFDMSGGRAIAVFENRWSNYHAEVENSLEAQNAAYFNPKHLIVPELCRLLLERSERGPFAAEVADYFLEALSFAEEIDSEFRENLLNALLLKRDAGDTARAISVLDTLNAKFGSTWRGGGRVALSLTGLESELRAARDGNSDSEVGVQEKLLERMKVELGSDHRSTLIRANNLAALYSSLHRYSDAEELHRKTYEQRRHSLGRHAEDTLISLSNLATAILAQGRAAEAEILLKEVLSAKQATLGD
jgi:hypothetical protein